MPDPAPHPTSAPAPGSDPPADAGAAPASAASMVTRCADELRRSIVRGLVRGELAVGDLLPTERALAVQFGVNRTTVRAALGLVARDGLLAVRQGSGYRVRDFRRTGGPELVPALLELAREEGELGRTVAELLRIRRWLAGALLEALSSTRPSDGALAAVEAAIDAMEASVGAGASRLAEADLGVIRAWIDASGSAVLALFLNPVALLLDGLPELGEAVYAEPMVNVALWRAMVERVRAGDLDAGAMLAALRARDEATLARMEDPP